METVNGQLFEVYLYVEDGFSLDQLSEYRQVEHVENIVCITFQSSSDANLAVGDLERNGFKVLTTRVVLDG